MICSLPSALDGTSPPLWNPLARLVCLGCDATLPMGPEYGGCPSCGGTPLVTAYAPPSLPAGDAIAAIGALYAQRLPIHPERLVRLGQGRTPLVSAAAGAGAPVMLKLEGQNPTGSHKDRFHAIAAAIARDLRHRAVVTSSTGNHGLACAAFAAAAGVDSLVFLNPEATTAIATQIASHGGRIAVLPDAVRPTVAALVDDGWCPATSADPSLAGRANPYGTEGYRAIAYEIVQQLGRVPATVAVPAASGDTFYGIWRGFQDLHELLELPMPRLLACQPAGAAPLALTERLAAEAPCEVEHPQSIALSARDPQSGWHATVAIRSGGTPVEVPDALLVEVLARLARHGHSIEAASALSVAGLELAREAGTIDPDAEAVAVITSSGANWTEHLEQVLGGATLMRTAEDLDRELAAAGLSGALSA